LNFIEKLGIIGKNIRQSPLRLRRLDILFKAKNLVRIPGVEEQMLKIPRLDFQVDGLEKFTNMGFQLVP